jgi:hypothetical protein
VGHSGGAWAQGSRSHRTTPRGGLRRAASANEAPRVVLARRQVPITTDNAPTARRSLTTASPTPCRRLARCCCCSRGDLPAIPPARLGRDPPQFALLCDPIRCQILRTRKRTLDPPPVADLPQFPRPCPGVGIPRHASSPAGITALRICDLKSWPTDACKKLSHPCALAGRRG